MKNFFSETLKRREREAGLQEKPAPAAPAQGTQPTQADFFYGTPADLRKKRQPK